MNETLKFDGTLLIRQRVITTYRAELFGLLAQYCNHLVVVAGKPKLEEGIAISKSIEPGEIIPVENIEIGKGTFLIYWQKDLMDHVTKIQPDVIVTEANPRFTDTSKLVRWARKNDRPIIGWGLGTTNFFKRKFESIRRFRQKRTYAKFDSLISYSELAKQQYAQAGFTRDVFVAHNATVKRRPMPERQFRADGKFKVINIGRLVEHKNVELLINSIAKLSEAGLDIGLEIAGDGPHRNALETAAKEAGVDCVFHGMQMGEQLKKIASECDLFVLPGLGGLAIQEAMSFGLPAIVSEADGTELDLVRDSNGWHVPPNDLSALTNAIQEAYQQRKKTYERGLESYRIFSEEINLETMAEKFMRGVIATHQRKKAIA